MTPELRHITEKYLLAIEINLYVNKEQQKLCLYKGPQEVKDKGIEKLNGLIDLFERAMR